MSGFSEGAGTVAGKIQGGASAVAYTTTGADYAEYFLIADLANKPEANEIVTIDSNMSSAVKKASSGDKTMVGVVSTNPGFIGNGPLCYIDDENCDENYAKTNVTIGLNGQLPVKVSLENGSIAQGDQITAGTTPGVGVKATTASQIVGYALESYTNVTEKATINVYINPGYYSPPITDQLQDAQSLTLEDLNVTGSASILNLNISGSARIKNLEVTGLATIANLTVTTAATFQGNLTVGGHIITTGNTPQTEVLGASSSQVPAIEATLIGNDVSGFISIKVISSENVQPGDLIKIVFNKPYTAKPKVFLDSANLNASSVIAYKDVTKEYFILKSNSELLSGKVYEFNYLAVQ